MGDYLILLGFRGCLFCGDRISLSISKESQVHQRISELRKEGQWSASRLPKLVEASRPKSQWDYLLEEMQWMAADFAQERRWKEAAAKKVWLKIFMNKHEEFPYNNPFTVMSSFHLS